MNPGADLTRLARPEVLALKAYESARSLVASGQAGSVFLDANESPTGTLNRYPEPQPKALVARFEQLLSVAASNLVIGRGSDEAIDLLVRAFCRPGADAILICPPTYGVYEIAAQIQGARVLRAPLKMSGWQTPEVALDLAAIKTALASTETTVKLVFLCSPNNPTGTAFSADTLSKVCELAADRALVVVDEAYGEFSQETSMLTRLPRHPNLVVLRTLSKAWALAAARCGVSVASPEISALLHKIRAPYPIPQPVTEVVLAATNESAQAGLKARVQLILDEREALRQRLEALPIVTGVFATSANFLLVRFKDPVVVMRATRSAGIIVRDRSREIGLAGCIRITVGTTDENDALLRTLAEVPPI